MWMWVSKSRFLAQNDAIISLLVPSGLVPKHAVLFHFWSVAWFRRRGARVVNLDKISMMRSLTLERASFEPDILPASQKNAIWIYMMQFVLPTHVLFVDKWFRYTEHIPSTFEIRKTAPQTSKAETLTIRQLRQFSVWFTRPGNSCCAVHTRQNTPTTSRWFFKAFKNAVMVFFVLMKHSFSFDISFCFWTCVMIFSIFHFPFSCFSMKLWGGDRVRICLPGNALSLCGSWRQRALNGRWSLGIWKARRVFC